MMNSSLLNMNPINWPNPQSHSLGSLTLPANTMPVSPQQVLAPNQLNQSQKPGRPQAFCGPPLYYAQTISRATNLHLQQLMRNNAAVVASNQYLTERFQYSPATMGAQDRKLIMQQQQKHKQQRHQHQQLNCESLMSVIERQASLNRPLCRCRVMYLGSSVPHITKNGLHGIQEPLRHLYPEKQFNATKLASVPPLGRSNMNQLSPSANTIDISHLSASLGIDSWLSVWSNGLLLENIDEFGCEIKRFFSIESLHYCAAVRFFDTSRLNYNSSSNSTLRTKTNESSDQNNNNISNESSSSEQQPDLARATADEANQQASARNAIRFLPLDAPLFQYPGMLDPSHPPMFAAIMRRTTGIKVLECHAFICRRDAAANALVRCCTHSYADFLSAKRLSIELCRRRRSQSCSREAAAVNRREPPEVEEDDDEEDPTYELADVISAKSDRRILGNVAALKSLNAPHSTGTSNETDNSLEVSSEDNYAIISKHYQTPRVSHGTDHYSKPRLLADSCQQAAAAGEFAGKTARSFKTPNQQPRRKQKRTKGSSSSTTQSTRSLFDDFMPLIKDPARAVDDADDRAVGELAKLSHSLDVLGTGAYCAGNSDGSLEGTAGNLAHYSVAGKGADRGGPRHSRSMQNLEGPLEFSATSATRGHSQARQRSRRHRRSGFGERSRKAASCQDMMAPELVTVACPNPGACQLREGLVCCGGPSGIGEGALASGREQCVGASGSEHRLAASQPAPMMSGSQKKSSIKSHRSKSRHQLREQQQPATSYHPAELQQLAGAHPHLVAPFPAQQLYQAPVALYPPFAAPPQLAGAAGYHPMPCYLAGYPQPAAMYQPTLYDHSYLGGPFAAEPNQSRQQLATASQTAPKQRKSAAKSSLATRFRCLSPPVNFLISRSRPSSQNLQPPAPAAAAATEPADPSSGDSENQELASAAPEAAQVEGEVISGQPGFVSHSAAASGARRLHEKKMGWIKRLSLTMSGSSGPDSQASPDFRPEVAEEAQNGQQQERHKKRSSFLFGNLTLGRSSKPKLSAES